MLNCIGISKREEEATGLMLHFIPDGKLSCIGSASPPHPTLLASCWKSGQLTLGQRDKYICVNSHSQIHWTMRAPHQFCKRAQIAEACHRHLAAWFSVPHSCTHNPLDHWYQISPSVTSPAAVPDVLGKSLGPWNMDSRAAFPVDPIHLNTIR